MASNTSRITVYLSALLIGLLPAWMVLLPLDITDAPQNWQVFLRTYFFAVTIAQLLFVLLTMATSFSPFRSVQDLPSASKTAVVLWLVIASYLSFQPGKDYLSAAIGFARLFISGLFFLALVDLTRSAGLRFITATWVSVGCGFLLYLSLYTIYVAMFTPEGEEWVIRAPGVNNIRHTGFFAFASVVAGLFGLIAFQNRHLLLCWFTPLSFASAGLGLALWTGSRGPLLASLVLMVVTVFVAQPSRKLVLAFCAVAIFLATAVVALLPVPHPAFGIAGATGLADISAQSLDQASSGRMELWADAIERIIQKPWLGWGVNQFAKFGTDVPDSFYHPHNFPLQLLFSGGVISALMLLLTLIPALRKWKWPYTHGPNAVGVGGVVGIFVYSLNDGALYFGYPTTIFLLLIATSIAPVAKQDGPGKLC